MCINACLPWKMIFASEQLGARGGRPLGGPAARPAPADSAHSASVVVPEGALTRSEPGSAQSVTVCCGPSARASTKAGSSCWTTSSSVYTPCAPGSMCSVLSAADAWRRSCCFWYWSVKNATVSTIGSSRSSVSPRLYQKIPRLERITHTPPAKTMPTV